MPLGSKYPGRFLILLLPYCFACSAFEDNTWLSQVENRVDEEAVQWLRDKLKDDLTQRQPNELLPFSHLGKCHTSTAPDIHDPKLFVFVSFSLPDTTWLSLSKEVVRAEGIFVIRGLPENSFQALAKRLLALKEKGLTTPVQIHPQLFEKYAISSVPSFVVIGENGFDKLSGNVSLRFVLDQFADHGETATVAKLLREKLHDK